MAVMTILVYCCTNAQTANRFDIIICELMADPTPQVNLPNNEWIELKNTSSQTFNLSGWRVGDVASQSGSMPAYNLKPDSFVIICAASAATAMAAYGPTITVTGFPSLDNTADIIYLRSAAGKVIHTVNYNDAWYQNELKKEGGWSLEMIDTKNPCSGFNNWKASTAINGGTPDKNNSVDAINPDNEAPKLLRGYAVDSVNVVLIFDEPLDSAKAAIANSYTISDAVGIPQSAVVQPATFDKVILKLNTALQRNKIYTVTVSGVFDCAGNMINGNSNSRIGLSELAGNMDIVVNEVLFNPKSTGTDYVEIYNRSKKILDLKQTYIANRNSSGVIINIKQLSADS